MSTLVGSSRRFSCTFKVSGTLTNPTTVTAVVKGGGAETSYVYGVGSEVVRQVTGSYYIDVAFTAPGTWSVLWIGTGAVVAVAKSSETVVATGFSAA